MSDPADQAAHLALALERATNAQGDVETLNHGLATLRTEMLQGFTEMKAHLAKIELQNAQRSGAERLGAWLIGFLGMIGTIAATIWAAIHTSTHH